MQLQSIFVRFYRSLNYDFIRASDGRYVPDPWDATPRGDYPFVRIKLRPGITTVVGGNESGKTQVLRAITAALTGTGYERSDFCRYSRFFGVDPTMTKPEFGALYTDVTDEDRKAIQAASEHKSIAGADQVAIFRMNATPQYRLYVRHDGTWSQGLHIKTPSALDRLNIPAPFEIDADVPLPDSVPIDFLATGAKKASIGRDVLRTILDGVKANRDWFASDSQVSAKAKEISSLFSDTRDATDDELKTYELAHDLLTKVAGLDRALFVELQDAVRSKNGYANSIVDTINGELAKALNFPHWWSQDSQFELFVSLYEFDLVFMIRDRTGRSYGFDERSDGLKYFLSYFVQYLAHQPRTDGRPEILLMDEPDRFLSASGQQDLLAIFDDFASPEDPSRRPVQVVYVTHSPFLIDKNEADRIRVLEKGEYEEGTRVVKSVAANHYEPLRSAFGSFVAETTFIGNCNVMVEGPSDQVLIAGVSRWLKERGVANRDRLDLNRVTIVPAGGTRHIPYLVYLARGRDVDKPPVVVLLDNDKDGDDARRDLAAGGAYGDKLLDPELVLQLGKGLLDGLSTESPGGVVGIEDLIPFNIALAAAERYCREFVPTAKVGDYRLSADDVLASAAVPSSRTEPSAGLLKCLERTIADRSGITSFHLDKVAFARATVDVLAGNARDSRVTHDDIEAAARNFGLLLSKLAEKQRVAERAETVERISSRINRAKRDFMRTHEKQARNEDVLDFIEEISGQLDLSPEAEEIRAETRRWLTQFGLVEDPRALVHDLPGLFRAMDGLAYQATRGAQCETPTSDDDADSGSSER